MHCRYDVIVALDTDIKQDILKMVQSEWQNYYDAKICMLDQFSDYLGSDILRTGGTAVLESELSGIIRPIMQESRTIPDLLRPSLHKGLLSISVNYRRATSVRSLWFALKSDFG